VSIHHETDRPPSTSDFAPSPSAPQLADALRADVAVRRRLSAEDAGEDAARLTALGDLEGLLPVAKPGAGAPVIRAVRAVLRAFLRPWFAAQTIFNREIGRRFQTTVTDVRDLDRRTPRLEQAVQQLEERILRLEQSVRGASAVGATGAPDGAADVASLERMFVHSRLPRPPARVLASGGASAAMAAELESFGFDVVVADVTAVDAAAVDVVLHLDASGGSQSGIESVRQLGTATARALIPGGRLVLSLRPNPAGSGTTADYAELTALFDAFHIEDALVAWRDGVRLRVRTLPGTFDSVPPMLVLIHARRR
jgi:hypothetical protein